MAVPDSPDLEPTEETLEEEGTTLFTGGGVIRDQLAERIRKRKQKMRKVTSEMQKKLEKVNRQLVGILWGWEVVDRYSK